MIRIGSLILIMLLSCSQVISQDLSYRKVGFINILDSNTLKNFNKKIYDAGLTGKIKAYENDSLTRIYTFDELLSCGSSEKVIQVHPEIDNPDYFGDSVVIIPFNLEDNAGIFISEKWILNNENFEFRSYFNAFSINYNITINETILGGKALFWIDYNDLSLVLNEVEIDQLKNALFTDAKRYYSNSSNSSLEYDLRKYIGEYTVNELNSKIYQSAIEDHTIVFHSNELKSILPHGKIIQGLISYETEEEFPDPDYPDYCFSYVVSSTYNSEKISLNAVKVIHQFNEADFSHKCRINTIALLDNVYDSNYIELFWIAYKDLFTILSKIEMDILTYGIYKASIDRFRRF